MPSNSALRGPLDAGVSDTPEAYGRCGERTAQPPAVDAAATEPAAGSLLLGGVGSAPVAGALVGAGVPLADGVAAPVPPAVSGPAGPPGSPESSVGSAPEPSPSMPVPPVPVPPSVGAADPVAGAEPLTGAPGSSVPSVAVPGSPFARTTSTIRDSYS